jgi:two-component system LytT family response regulator
LLLDDELPGLAYLKMLCGQMPELDVVKAFNDPLKLIAEAPELDFDLCLLDIEMPGMSGLDVARALKGKPVIFITAYKEYAAEAFDLEAIDYVRKPVQKERLERAIRKALDRLSKPADEKAFVQLNTNKGKALIFFDQLLRVTTAEVDKRDKVAWLEGGQQLTLKNIGFEQLLSLLPAQAFNRVNKGEILAIRAVHTYVHDEITTTLLDEQGKPVKTVLGDGYKDGLVDKLKT